jgi:hypothetical protein
VVTIGAPLVAQTTRAPRPAPASFTGRVRVYYIAADETDWTFIPARGDQALTGKKDDFSKDPGARGELDPNASTYRKALYRE